MNEMQQYIEEYGVPAPVPEDYETSEAYQAAYNAWFDGLAAFIIRKEEEEAARIAEEEAARQQAEKEEAERLAREEEAARQAREEAAKAVQTVPDTALVAEYPVSQDRYPVGSYVDPAGNVWSPEGELLSPGTTPAMEPAEAAVEELIAEELAAEPVTGEPVIDTGLLLLDLVDALIGEEGMTSDVDGIQETLDSLHQTLDHSVMTTSFQDYTVTEGLLLLLLLSAFVAACAKMLKGGFSWLR